MFDFSIKEVSQNRKSIRTYTGEALRDADRKKIDDCVEYLNNVETLFGSKVRIKIFDVDNSEAAGKFGTYGVIKNAKTFIGIASEKTPTAEEDTGYVFEKLVLYAASIGLGTCWLGGTYNKSEVAKLMDVKDDEVFHIVTPIGYPADKSHVLNKIMRKAIKADSRKPWKELFFNGSFDVPLDESDADGFASVLECVRLAPSAANKQPWRIVKDKNTFHFYEKREVPSGSSFDIQKLDIGIAACHFEFAVKEKGINGSFGKSDPCIRQPEKTDYLFSWIADETEV